MEIRQLQTFKTVADLNSFTRAAQTLQYSQASITAHIQQLEEEMGLPLFDRLGKNIHLTVVGQELYQYTVELLAVYSKIQHISSDDMPVKGEIRIGAAETITVYKLGAVLSEYKKNYPKVTISLINDDCLLLRERLHTGEIDLAITLEPMVNDPFLITHVWSEEPLVLIGERDHPLHTMNEAEGECIIFSPKKCALRQFFEGYLMEKGISTHNHLEFSNMEAIKQCVASGLGISLIPYMSAQTLLREDKIKVIESSIENPVFYAQISYHKNKWLSNAHKKFIELLLAD
ncbi:MAG: LysR family transcriptional regulator [Neobacillus sp.]